MERFLLMYDDVERFCTQLKTGALEGLCTCVSEGFFPGHGGQGCGMF